MEILRNTTRSKLSLTAPKYSNFEVLKRSSSLGGLYHPRPGSSAGKLAILQRQERNNVAFKQVQKNQLPSWAFEIGLTEESMRELTLDLIARKWVKGESLKDGAVKNIGSRAATTSKADNQKGRQKRRRNKAGRRASSMTATLPPPHGGHDDHDPSNVAPVVLALKNFKKPASATQSQEEHKEEIRTAKVPSAGACGVRVAVSSTGDILSTVKPEYENLASKPCHYRDFPQFDLTNVQRPATTPNPCLDYENFARTKMKLMRTMKDHRRDVWQEKQKIEREHRNKVSSSDIHYNNIKIKISKQI